MACDKNHFKPSDRASHFIEGPRSDMWNTRNEDGTRTVTFRMSEEMSYVQSIESVPTDDCNCWKPKSKFAAE